MKSLVRFVVVSACVVVLFAGCTSSKTAAKDVKITKCAASPSGGHPTASGTIHNKSGKSSAYTIHVKFSDSSGNGVGDGLTAVAKVDPATNATWHATGTVNAKGPITCKLGSVTRNALP